MRKPPATFGPYLVNLAGVISIKERTRHSFRNQIALRIGYQISGFQFGWLYTHGCGNSGHIGFIKNRTGGFATISTLQTVYLLKNGIVDLFEALGRGPVPAQSL